MPTPDVPKVTDFPGFQLLNHLIGSSLRPEFSDAQITMGKLAKWLIQVEVINGVVVQIRDQDLLHKMRKRDEADRVTIGRRFRDILGTDHASAACAILNDDRLVPRLSHLLGY